MSKQLSAESQASKAIKAYAAQLLAAQERIKQLEDALRTISIECPGDAQQLANEALTPNNTNKEDES